MCAGVRPSFNLRLFQLNTAERVDIFVHVEKASFVSYQRKPSRGFKNVIIINEQDIKYPVHKRYCAQCPPVKKIVII